MEGFDEFKNILVGVDESEGAQKAFQYAVKQASKTGAALLIASILEIEELNVYEALDPEYLSQKQSQLLLNLEKYKQYAENSGVKNIQLYSGEGDPAKEITKT
ncbi:TPA: universal stress protein, partial [Enterococcus faecium]